MGGDEDLRPMTVKRMAGERLPVVRSLDELAGMVEREPGLHVRISRGPDADAAKPSRDYESGLDLPGLSANQLRPERWWTRPLEDWLARRLCQYLHLLEEADDGRVAWVLTGREVARGPDHEPVLADPHPVAVLDRSVLEEAARRYRERFDVGRDSTGSAG
jgi:hypothetical protein